MLDENNSFARVLDTTGATPEPGGEPTISCGYADRSHTVWFKYAPPAGGTLDISTSASDYSTVTAVFRSPDGSCNNLEEIHCVAGTDISCLTVENGVPIFIEVGDTESPGTGGILVFHLAFDARLALHWETDPGLLLPRLLGAPVPAGITDLSATVHVRPMANKDPPTIWQNESIGFFESFQFTSASTFPNQRTITLSSPDGVILGTGKLARLGYPIEIGITCSNQLMNFPGQVGTVTNNLEGDTEVGQTTETRYLYADTVDTQDGVALKLTFKSDASIAGLRFKLVLGSDEFPEYAARAPTPADKTQQSGLTCFPDTFAAFVDGRNVALVQDDQGHDVLLNVAPQVFKLNNNTPYGWNVAWSRCSGIGLEPYDYRNVDFGVEYDGFAAQGSVADTDNWEPLSFSVPIAPSQQGREHTLKFVISDVAPPSDDGIYDTSAFISDLEFVECHCPPQDADGDGDVDLSDFARFQGCFNGPNRAYPAGAADVLVCSCLDSNRDADVDLADFGRFQACFNGPNRTPACAPTGWCSQGLQGGGDGGQSLAEGGGMLEGLDSFDVVFDLQSPQDGQTLTQGEWVQWKAVVSVEGTNQGLGGFLYNLYFGSGDGPSPGPDGIWGTADDENIADVTLDTAYDPEVFAVAGPNGKPTTGTSVTSPGSAGGAGMNAMTSSGYNSTPGMLVQVGAGWLDWNPWRFSGPPLNRWLGDDTWGVGLDDRKDELLLDEQWEYELNVGWIDTTNLEPGHYVLVLVPGDTITVLRSDVDLSVTQIGSVVAPTAAVSGPDAIAFDVTVP